MVNTKKSRNAGRGPAPATTLSKLIKKLNEENQPPGGWYKPQASSLEKPQASSLKPEKRRASSVKPQASSLKPEERQATSVEYGPSHRRPRTAFRGGRTADR
jgi:hypothetical protein